LPDLLGRRIDPHGHDRQLRTRMGVLSKKFTE
jgi:hypothetical protein